MYMVKLRKVGGSVMLTVPPAILELLDMDSNTLASLHIDDGKLIVVPEKHKKYTLHSLLTECHPCAADSVDSEWTSGYPQGQELI